MTQTIGEARKYEDLDAHGVQEALRAEMSDEEVGATDANVEGPGDNNSEEVTEEPSEEIVNNPLSENGEIAPEDVVWTAAQMAEHARYAEALLFAAVEPLDETTLKDRLPEGADIAAILEALQAQYQNHGIILSRIANKWRFVTAPDVAHILDKERVEPRKLSKAALETLAIIAYHQPCTRADIEDVRGVAVSKGSLDQLLEIGWIRLRGRRKDAPGRPVLYGTSQVFLEHFGLENLSDLPGISDLKAAGLLDARLPPDFQIPTPNSDELEEESEDLSETPEFAQDFMDGDRADEELTTDE